MYNRNRYGGNWYQAAFWLIIGLILGQFFRFNIVLQEPESALPAISQTQNS